MIPARCSFRFVSEILRMEQFSVYGISGRDLIQRAIGPRTGLSYGISISGATKARLIFSLGHESLSRDVFRPRKFLCNAFLGTRVDFLFPSVAPAFSFHPTSASEFDTCFSWPFETISRGMLAVSPNSLFQPSCLDYCRLGSIGQLDNVSAEVARAATRIIAAAYNEAASSPRPGITLLLRRYWNVGGIDFVVVVATARHCRNCRWK